MPHRQCPTCRAVVPAGELEQHKRREHRPRRLSKVIKDGIKARDGHRCVVCGSTERLEVHHKDDDPTNDAIENLETRCVGHNPRGGTFWYADDPRIAHP